MITVNQVNWMHVFQLKSLVWFSLRTSRAQYSEPLQTILHRINIKQLIGIYHCNLRMKLWGYLHNFYTRRAITIRESYKKYDTNDVNCTIVQTLSPFFREHESKTSYFPDMCRPTSNLSSNRWDYLIKHLRQ